LIDDQFDRFKLTWWFAALRVVRVAHVTFIAAADAPRVLIKPVAQLVELRVGVRVCRLA
jgi:hypothetical protein